MGRNCVFFYSERLQEKARKEKYIREKLLDAFDNEGFYMVYQPKVDVRSIRLSGFEALVRMKDPEIRPAEFIPRPGFF